MQRGQMWAALLGVLALSQAQGQPGGNGTMMVTNTMGGGAANSNMSMSLWMGETGAEFVRTAVRMAGARLQDMLSVAIASDTSPGSDSTAFSEGELARFLFLNADNGDGRVNLWEFVDYWAEQFPEIKAPVLAVAFELLDNLNADGGRTEQPLCNAVENVFTNLVDVGDGVLLPDDLPATSVFVGTDDRSIGAVRAAFETLLTEAASRVERNLWKPFRVGEEYSVEFDYAALISLVDKDKDGIVTQTELNGVLTAIGASPSSAAGIEQWVSAATSVFAMDGVNAVVLFYALDSDGDRVWEAEDMKNIYIKADVNRDERMSLQELYRYFSQREKFVRRMMGSPIKPFNYDCPPVYWDDECGDPDVKSTIATMDADFNFDGSVCKDEIRRLIYLYPGTKEEGRIGRPAWLTFNQERYDVPMAASAVEFDAADKNGDGYISWADIDDMEEECVCACEYRVHALASARAAIQLAKQRKNNADWLRMKYFLLMAESAKKAKQREMTDRTPDSWYWMTMAGRPARGDCKTCGARDSWGRGQGEGGDGGEGGGMADVEAAEDWKIMKMLAGVVKKMKEMGGDGKDQDEIGSWLAEKMQSMKMKMEKKWEAISGKMDDDDDDDDEEDMKRMMMEWNSWKDAQWGKGWKDNGWGKGWKDNGWGKGWKEEGKWGKKWGAQQKEKASMDDFLKFMAKAKAKRD